MKALPWSGLLVLRPRNPGSVWCSSARCPDREPLHTGQSPNLFVSSALYLSPASLSALDLPRCMGNSERLPLWSEGGSQEQEGPGAVYLVPWANWTARRVELPVEGDVDLPPEQGRPVWVGRRARGVLVAVGRCQTPPNWGPRCRCPVTPWSLCPMAAVAWPARGVVAPAPLGRAPCKLGGRVRGSLGQSGRPGPAAACGWRQWCWGAGLRRPPGGLLPGGRGLPGLGWDVRS